MNEENFLKGMAVLTVSFPAGSITREEAKLRTGVYRQQLADLSDEAWERAVERAVAISGTDELKFFPGVGKLRELAGPTALQTRSSAAAAFEVLENWWVRRHGILKYAGPELGDVIDRDKVLEKLGPVAFEAFTIAGGRHAFERMTDHDRPFLLKRFEDAFQEADGEFRRTGELPGTRDRGALPPKLRELAAGVGKPMPEALKR